ncbi:MAG: replisome organizer [Clostridia bacterium]|nr:replisome organizer [Clostridia bacterium]
MANRRMFASSVVNTDRFLSMDSNSRCLYFHLGVIADDDGFVASPLMSCRMIGCDKAHLKELEENGYLIFFESGVCAITHWKQNNYLQKDRYTETVYKEEKSHLILSENNIYFYSETPLSDSVYSLDTQVREGKDREDQVRKEREEGKSETPSEDTTSSRENTLPLGTYNNVFLTEEELNILKQDYPLWEAMIENLSVKMQIHGYSYRDHFAVLKKWAEEDKNNPLAPHQKDNSSPKSDSKPRYDFEKIRKNAFLLQSNQPLDTVI